ncbi:MAG: MopE-related protein [Pseudomonadota bacterium]|nr:MopE-related protein [Pseudomonadota bacterium]
MRALSLLALLAACAPDAGLKVYNTPPEVAFTAPADGTTVAEGATVTFEAQLQDGQDGASALQLVWQNSDGSTPEGTQSITDGGVVFVVDGFLAGDPTITLKAIDGSGDEGSDSVTLHVVADATPVASFVSPLEDEVVLSEDSVRVELRVSDADEPDLTDLLLVWGDAAADVGAPTAADSAGSVVFYLDDLPAGATRVSVTVTDSLGASASQVVGFDVVLADADGDGSRDVEWGGDDCDDADPAIHPGADELCDGVDQDCDGVVDEDDATDALTWYADADADGFGDAASTTEACDQPAAYVADTTDCDDGDAGVNPAAIETCDGEDDDCDGTVDEDDAADAGTWYIDIDGDGAGGATTTLACDQPTGTTAAATDCDDGDAGVYPGADEYCDLEDDDCDGTIDEDDAVDAPTWYLDGDADGYGDTSTLRACVVPAGYAEYDGDCDDGDGDYHPGAAETDCSDPNDYNCDGSNGYADNDADGWAACQECDDTSAAVSPDATEVCNDVDDDCDGTVDEDAADASTWYADADADSHGDAASTDVDCDQPYGYVSDAEDCNDADADVNPGELERCDGDDDDCDGEADEDSAVDVATWYADTDADTFGDAASADIDCDQPTGFVADDTDCDDGDSGVSPAALEQCDGEDDDCDGEIDEDSAVDATTWYADLDTDGYGDAAASDVECTAPSGYVGNDDDCDDGAAGVSPGALETCDGEDDDCDGDVDEDSAVDATTWYADADGDTYGDAGVSDVECGAPSGYVADATDCDDGDSGVSPADLETCDGEDDDCDGDVDEDSATDAPTWYADADRDTYGDPCVSDVECSAPSGYVGDANDCDDSDSGVSPADLETCDGEDDDCDGVVDEDSATDAPTWYADADRDTYGDPSVSDVECSAPTGYVANASDCDDTDSGVSPADVETCDGEDDDCDGTVDDAATDASTWYRDGDSDTYGDASVTDFACTAPGGYVANDDDCDDALATVSPADTEYCNSRDDDCDGSTDEGSAADAATWYRDADGDTYGDASVTEAACSAPGGYVSNDDDCDDTRATVSPADTETCNSRDDDCDGEVDEDSATDATTWYADADGDTYGNAAVTDVECTAPSGYVASATDCDDTDSGVSPADLEYCDGEDDDCDGFVDESSAVDADTWYRDVDSDTYGDVYTSSVACSAPSGYVSDPDDCDDARPASNPGADEYCNGEDDDCDGAVDEDAALDAGTWYLDGDDDDFGRTAASTTACEEPAGYAAAPDDCDDTDGDAYPGAYEYCDGDDDDCDGDIDEDDAVDAATWYADADADAYGNASVTVAGCDAPSGYVSNDDDCNDATAAISPGDTEICDSSDTDEDCDGLADDSDPSTSSATESTFYADTDADGYAGSSTSLRCDASSTWLTTSTDCDDSSALISPGGVEVCDAADADEDCDGVADPAGASGCTTFYADTDGDGFGDTTSACLCSASGDYTAANDDDCDDASAAVSPAADEDDTNGIDDDCDGTVDEAAAAQWAPSGDYDVAWLVTTFSTGEATDFEFLAGGGDGDADGHPDVLHGYNSSDYGGSGSGLVTVARGGSGRSLTADSGVSGRGGDALGPAAWLDDQLLADGMDEVLLGAPQDTATAYDGRAFIVSGASMGSGLTSYADLRDTTALLGATARDDFGAAVANVGDVYGDGYDDFLVSAATGSTTYTGYVYLFDGPLASGELSATTASSAIFTADTVGDYAGAVLDGNVDLDGDGFDDFLIAAPYDDTSTTNAGAVYVILGGSLSGTTDLGTGYDARLRGDGTNDYLGLHMDAGEDITGDGYDDFLLGTPGYGAGNEGRVYLYSGVPTTGAASVADIVVSFSTAAEGGGADVAALGDMNGDGHNDFAVSSQEGNGHAYLFFDSFSAGTYTTDDANASFYATSAMALGETLESGGDIDQDGLADLLIGAPSNGALYVVHGNFNRLLITGSEGDRVYGSSADNPGIGASFAGGDFNGDGYDDAIFGGIYVGSSTSGGGGELFLGPFSTGESTSLSDGRFAGTGTDQNGTSMCAGDFDGDLYDDWIFGAPYDDTTVGSDAGSVALVSGAASSYSATLTARVSGERAGDRFGQSLATLGDVDGDSAVEILVGAPLHDIPAVDAGRAYIYTSPVSTSSTAVTTLQGDATGDYFGYSVGGGGDVDGDGFPDFVIGAYGNDAAGTDAGAAYLFTAYATGTVDASSADTILLGEAASDAAGRGVAICGDVDDDGYDDVLVGAPGNDTDFTNGGAVYLFLGPVASGTISAGTADAIITADKASDGIGVNVAGAGDINGDGYDDIVFSNPANDDYATDAGKVGFRYGPVVNRETFWWFGLATDELGASVGPLGDTDNDGIPELGIGAPREAYGDVWIIEEHPVRER